MFEELVAEAEGSRGVRAWARVENAACARRLAAMLTILDGLQSADGSADREQWCIDNWAAACAEVGAAQQITSGVASNQLLAALALRDRLPRVGEVFTQGLVAYALVSAIVWRTALIKDLDALAAVDRHLARALGTWEPMSQAKTITAIDFWVQRCDPHALRRSQRSARSRSVDVHIDDDSGMGSLWGVLFAHHAKALDDRLAVMAREVCDGDPRTVDQRRADAMGAWAVGATRLACACGAADCPHTDPATTDGGVGAHPVVVYVIAHEDTLAEDTAAATVQDAALDGTPPASPSGKPLREMTLAEAAVDPVPPGFTVTRPGVMFGGPVLAGPLLRRAALNAAVRRVFHPRDAHPEPRYRPSTQLADFVRCRDLTCRFPGCDAPATACDVDHTIPHPAGPTQASNLKCLCRRHHLLKTFWGWQDHQSPDGTVEWKSPTGRTFTTRPGSRLLFPSLCRPTAPITVGPDDRSVPNSGLTMPRRQRTRAQDRDYRNDRERQLNATDPLPAEPPEDLFAYPHAPPPRIDLSRRQPDDVEVPTGLRSER